MIFMLARIVRIVYAHLGALFAEQKGEEKKCFDDEFR